MKLLFSEKRCCTLSQMQSRGCLWSRAAKQYCNFKDDLLIIRKTWKPWRRSVNLWPVCIERSCVLWINCNNAHNWYSVYHYRDTSRAAFGFMTQMFIRSESQWIAGRLRCRTARCSCIELTFSWRWYVLQEVTKSGSGPPNQERLIQPVTDPKPN